MQPVIQERGEYEKILVCDVDFDRVQDISSTMAQRELELKQHALLMKATLAELRIRKHFLEKERRKCAEAILSRKEAKHIKVRRYFDFKKKIAYDVRTDTDEVLQDTVRPLTDDDIQTQFEFAAASASIDAAPVVVEFGPIFEEVKGRRVAKQFELLDGLKPDAKVISINKAG